MVWSLVGHNRGRSRPHIWGPEGAKMEQLDSTVDCNHSKLCRQLSRGRSHVTLRGSMVNDVCDAYSRARPVVNSKR